MTAYILMLLITKHSMKYIALWEPRNVSFNSRSGTNLFLLSPHLHQTLFWTVSYFYTESKINNFVSNH